MKTSEKIKAARKGKGLTQKELALKVGAAQATINKIERDEIKNPSFDIAVKIANVLEKDVFELFSDESLKNQHSNLSEKEIDRMKILAFHSLDRYESNQIFFKQFDYNDQDPQELKKFEEYRLYLSEFKKGVLEKLIEVGFCTQEDIKEYRAYVYKQVNERKYTVNIIDSNEEKDIYKTFERELLAEIMQNDAKRKAQSELNTTKDQTNIEKVKKSK